MSLRDRDHGQRKRRGGDHGDGRVILRSDVACFGMAFSFVTLFCSSGPTLILKQTADLGRHSGNQ
jgi:hypothetical protein